jgi:hypothetical protein
LFEIKRAELFLTQDEVTSRVRNRGPKSYLAGREVSSLVHDTLRGMLDDREGKRVNYLKDFEIDWESFKVFTPSQLLGVMSIKPKVFQLLTSHIEHKGRQMKELLQHHKNIL